MKKRILAGILCFCVILTSLPTAVLAVEGTGNPASNSADSQNTPQLTPLGLLADDTNYDPDLAVEDDGNGIEETNPPETSFRGVVPVPPGYFLNQDPKQNEDLLEQISSITEENADEIYNALQALGLLDEEGNLNVNQTVNLNGEELTLEQVMDLLEDENTDLSQIANVDGVPIALGDLKIIIRIEMELARIQETYFSGKTFTEEALYNLNSLIEQIERDGIKIHDGTSPPEDEEVGDLVPPTDGEPEEPEEGPEEEPEEDSEEELPLEEPEEDSEEEPPLEEPEEDSEEEPFVEKPEKDPEEDSRMEAPINLDESLGIIQPSSMGLGPSRMQMMGSSTGTSEPPDNELGRLKIIEMYGYLWNDRRQSENFKLFGGETIEFSYRINSYQINNSESYDCLMYMDVYAYGNDNNFTEVSISEKKDDGSYFFSYTADWDEGVSKLVRLRAKPGYSPNPGLYVYGQLHIYLELYGGENIVFYDGQTYDSRASIRLHTAEYNDNIKFGTKMEYENSEGLSGEAEFFQFDDVSWRTGVRDDRNNLIETLESARNEMKGSEEATFSQPYRVNLNMSVEWANPEQLQTGRITKPRDSGSDVCKTIKILDYGVAGGPSLKGGYIEDIQNGHSNKFDISFGAKTTEIYMPQMGVGYNEFYFPIGLTTEVEEWKGSSYQSVDGASVKVYSSSVEIFDRDNPQLLSIEAREGNYSTGERIFITMTFNEIVDARNVRLEINGETYTHGDLAMNSRGVEIMGWYKVKEIDATGLTIRYLDSNEEDKVITDIFGNKLVPKGGGVGHPFDSVTIPGIQLESTLMRNAPTSFTVAFNDESKTASFSLTANMAEAYKTAIYNYHADHGDGDREAPFRIQLYKPNGEEGESLQVYLIDDESNPFSIEDYIVLEGSIDKDDIWLAVLQANEGTRDNLQWANILPLNREFTVGKLLYATDAYVKPEENTENYTLTLADTSDGELYRPVLQANLRLNDNTTSVPATTGTWSSSDEDIATISNDPNSFGQVILTGRKLGSVSFSYKPDSENEYIKRNPNFDVNNYIVTSGEYEVIAGGSIALIIPESASRIITRQINGQTPDVNVLWSSNISIFTQGDFSYKMEVFEGDFKTNDDLKDQIPVPLGIEGQEDFFIIDKDKNSRIIPGRVLTKSNNYGTPSYTVRVSVVDSLLPVPAQLAWIVVWPEMAEAKLIPPASIYLTDEETVDIGWTTKGTSENTLTITRVIGDNTTSVFYEDTLTGTSGNYRLNPGAIPDGRLKETYQIRFTVDNPGSSPSIDSFPLYVYNADALDIEVGGKKVNKVTMDNLASAISPPDTTSDIMKLRQELGLMEYIGINYKDYNWSSFSDGIKWTSSNDDQVSVNYNQGGFYENINLFTYSQYLPETIMAIASVKDGEAKITATHANTGMSASIDVEVKTLRDKLYMFQLTPARKTKLTYIDREGEEKTVYTNDDGVLALYEPAGIAGPIYFLSGSDSDTYIGTMYKESLQSGERDARSQQLYPLNRMTLYKPSEARIWLSLPDGSPLKNSKLTVRGGVYKNGDYIPQAGIGSSYNNIKDGKKDQSFTTDEYGFATIYMDSTQFWSEKAGESDQTVLTPQDKIKYIFEIKDIGNDQYYPLLFDVDSDLSGDTLRSRYGFWTAILEEVPSGKKNQPFVANQIIDYADEDGNALQVDVRKSTNFIGPNRIHPKARLDTTMYLWGEDINDAEDYTLYMKDDFGYTPLDQTGSQSQYPFSSILVATNSLILDADTMTNSGWIPDGDNRGLKTSLKNKDILVQETTLPFRIIDMTRVAKAEEDDNVIKSVRDMKDGSGAQSSLKFGGSGGLDKILLSLMGNLEDMSGPVDSSSFKLIISPSEDASVFNALIFAGKNTRELEDMDYSQEGIAISTKVFEQPDGLGIAGVGDMAKGGKELKKDLKSKFGSKNLKDVDFGGQLEGYYEAQIRYNFESKEWEVYTLGGGFTAGFGGSIKFNTNLKVGPVPVTAELELGGDIQLDFKTAVRYNEVEGYKWIDSDVNAVNDYLTTLRLNAYVYAFGGVGFDYSLVALKIGLYGRLQVDSQNKFLSRTYLEDQDKRQVNGQALGIDGEVGMKFVAVLAGFIEHETILFSEGFATRHTFNDWNYIENYWKNRGSGLEGGRSLMRMAAQSGLAMTPPTSTLQSRDYLETYARTWGQPQGRFSLFALDPDSGLKDLQSNANPSSDPAISDDGQIFAYISDSDSDDVYASRVHYSKLSGTSYQSSEPISSSNSFDFDGYGDSGVSLSGDQNFAVAAWVRLGAKIEGKNENDSVSLAEQNLLMNSTEILASVYNGNKWTSSRLTNDGSPDMAPAVAVNGDSAVVFWRSVYTADPGTEEDNELLNFKSQDNIMYSIYGGSAWSKAQILYNGSAGAVKGLEAAILPDGTAMAVYSLDRAGNNRPEDYEIAYSIVDRDGNPGMTMIATHDSNLNQNPQIVSANFGTGDYRFVIGWNNVTDEINDVRLLAVDGDGIMSNTFPESLSKLTTTGDAIVGADFKFARLNSSRDSIDDLTILWNEQLNHEQTGQIDHSIIRASKFRYADGSNSNLILSAPLEVAELPERTLTNSFDAYVSGKNQVKAIVQATWYDDTNSENISGFTVPGEKVMLYTATSNFIEDAIEVESIVVEYETLALNNLVPVSFTVRNIGINDITGLEITMNSGEIATLNDPLLPNESTTLYVWHNVGDKIEDVDYNLTANEDKISESDTVYMDYSDIGIQSMDVVQEEKGKRIIHLNIYNRSAATLSGKDREIKLAFFTDNLHEDKASITSSTLGVSSSENILTISGENALEQIDQGAFIVEIEYDLGGYVKDTLNQEEIPETGVYLFVDSWIEGKIGQGTENERMPEFYSSDNQASVLLTGAYARTGEKVSLNIDQGTNDHGNTIANISLRNNSLQDMTGGNLVTSLLSADGNVLETQPTVLTGTLEGESGQIANVVFGNLGSRVVVTAAPAAQDTLIFEGLPVKLSDFTSTSENNYVYTLDNVTVSSTVITAISGAGEAVKINGVSFSENGSLLVEIDRMDPTTITVEIGTRTYTLNIVPRKYSLTVYDGTGGGSYAAGDTVNITANPAPEGKVFDKWTTADGVAFANANASTTTFTMPAESVIVTATYRDKPTSNEDDSSGGSGSSSSGSSRDGRRDQSTVPAANGQVSINYTVLNKIANLSLSTSEINEIIKESKGNEVVIDLSEVKDISAVTLPKRALEAFENAGFDVTLKLPTGIITMDRDAAASIADQSGENLTIELKQVASSALTDEQKEAIKKDDIVFDINVISGTKKITNFDGSLYFQIPYHGPQPVAVWYLNEKGDLEKLNSIFENGMVTFSTNHLSYYVIGVDEIKTEVKWVNPFADVKEDSWFYEAVKYVYEKGLMKGTGDNTFSPNGTTTRGMIVTILHRLEDSPSAGSNSFSDVEGDKYYSNAVAWASENNIVSGYGNGKFGPEDAITREQLATILMNYAKHKGYDVSAKADLSKYEDSKGISNWAMDAISWANAENLIQGDGNNLTPTGNAIRAQAAAILSRFVERIIK